VSYTVQFRPRAAKQLTALPKGVRKTIAQVVDALAENPRPSGAVQLKGTDFMRVRVRDYRVIYELRDDVLLVLVVRIGHRRDISRGL
jgi:mRNA interferase RelE/StbE